MSLIGGNRTLSRFDAGLGTTKGMWEMLSEILEEDEVKLPESLNLAINLLCNGEAKVVMNKDVNHGQSAQD